jgi:hypothetical protein
MKVLIRFFIFLCFFCHVQLFPGVRVLFPENKIYFSKKVLSIGLARAKTQLELVYSYHINQINAAINSISSQKEKVEVPDESNILLEELGFVEQYVGKEFVKINIVYFESLLRNMALVSRYLNFCADLKMPFEGYKLLKEDVLKKLQNYDDDADFVIGFQNYCILIDELFDLNDNLIKQCKMLPTAFENFKFKDGILEYLQDEQFVLPQNYLFIIFQTPEAQEVL